MKMTENQEMLMKILGEFIDQEVKPRLKELNMVDEYPFWMRDRAAELGLMGIVVPEEYGGAGESLTTLIMMVMEAGKVNNVLGSLVNSSLTTLKMLRIGNKQQIETFLPRMLDEGRFAGMAWTEPAAGSDARAVQTTAVLDGDEWVLNGTKTFISYRNAVGLWQVSARTVDENGKEGISAFYIDAEAPGLSYGTHYTKFGFNGSDTGDIYFRNCRVPKWAVIGEVNKGLSTALSILDASRLTIAARGLGFAKGAFEQSFAYAKERKQFGRAICENQIIQHYFADMITEIEAGEALLYAYAEKVDAGLPLGKGGSVAKLYCSEVAKRVTDKAISICGGMGLLDDYGLDHFYKDSRTLTITEGTSEIQRNIIYKILQKEY
ncbi:MAG: Acyl-CoA dehydrogenase [Pelotomaculum sp. PtaB.Bin104]|nr:MAG: Acyl-CoA dehydrogenase [Pelotomaculum sp. PtaB.Bin104]